MYEQADGALPCTGKHLFAVEGRKFEKNIITAKHCLCRCRGGGAGDISQMNVTTGS